MAIFEYLESWYNTCRLQPALGYLSPNEFERRAAEGRPTGTESHREHTNLEPFRIGRPETHKPPSKQTPNTALRERFPSIGYRSPQCRWRQPSTVHRIGVGPVTTCAGDRAWRELEVRRTPGRERKQLAHMRSVRRGHGGFGGEVHRSEARRAFADGHVDYSVYVGASLTHHLTREEGRGESA